MSKKSRALESPSGSYYLMTALGYKLLGGLYGSGMEAVTLELGSNQASQMALGVAISLGSQVATLLYSFVSLAVATIYSDNLLSQVEMLFVLSVVLSIPVLLVVGFTPRRKRTNESVGGLSFIVSVRAALANSVFFWVLLTTVFSQVTHIFPNAVESHVLKNVMLIENTAQYGSALHLVGHIAHLVFNLFVGMLTRRNIKLLPVLIFCKIVALMYSIKIMRAEKIVFMDLMINQLLKIFAEIFMSLLIRQMNNDVLFYDLLLTGELRGGMYGSIQQVVHEMLSLTTNMFPALILSNLGFLNNGGCACGCGAPCPAYHRWNCPGDIGYACHNQLTASNPVFFGNPNRVAPCTWQPDAMVRAVRWAAFCVHPITNLISAALFLTYPVSTDIRREINEQTSIRDAGGRYFDPVTLSPLVHPSQKNMEIGELTKAEAAILTEVNGFRKLRRKLLFETATLFSLATVTFYGIVVIWEKRTFAMTLIAFLTGWLSWSIWSLLKYRSIQFDATVRLRYARLSLKRSAATRTPVSKMPPTVTHAMEAWRNRARCTVMGRGHCA